MNTDNVLPNLSFKELMAPTIDIASVFERWENDAEIIGFSQPNRNQQDLEKFEAITPDILQQRLRNNRIYLIYLDNCLVGEMSYMIDPSHLFKKEAKTAWIGITVGEPEARNKGVGCHAMQFLEAQIRQAGLKRIELGVFEFNEPAIKLYKKTGYKEIGRIPDFTFWQGRMWYDIRMEKYI